MTSDTFNTKEYGSGKEENFVLPDLLDKNLSIVFCGTAAGNRSARVNAYYVGRNNKFWDVLHEVGLTPVKLEPELFRELLKYDIGLTDLAKYTCGNDADLDNNDYDVDGFKKKFLKYEPRILAFNGKQAAKVYFGDKKIDYGLHKEMIGQTLIYVLPSTSGSANRSWYMNNWKEVALLAKTYRES